MYEKVSRFKGKSVSVKMRRKGRESKAQNKTQWNQGIRGAFWWWWRDGTLERDYVGLCWERETSRRVTDCLSVCDNWMRWMSKMDGRMGRRELWKKRWVGGWLGEVVGWLKWVHGVWGEGEWGVECKNHGNSWTPAGLSHTPPSSSCRMSPTKRYITLHPTTNTHFNALHFEEL